MLLKDPLSPLLARYQGKLNSMLYAYVLYQHQSTLPPIIMEVENGSLMVPPILVSFHLG